MYVCMYVCLRTRTHKIGYGTTDWARR